eukprot:CAMPEP_0175815890 /NCGR_PEP_ID=MMETSP0107_2-20121207/6211_1 /TAXON_ID=195067 ORGANISM="Goniomonas pacifica, Strain CCMP1869" /NCGR_SAMPLE_ID=MMETSP0107_2 /ASSEMBLY_ACC=CAM_ASM_000203 /LENGTH=269 /DNA_ID=CAMNT_0017127969 /DNA_START=15 /DNA_END=824 /DNA_ORIENTATION=+
MNADEDMQQEAATMARLSVNPASSLPPTASGGEAKIRIEDAPFTLVPGTGGHRASKLTQRLLTEMGGVPGILRFTKLFYELVKVDPHLDQFLRDHSDPHGERFANWIAEKFGHGTPWSEEKATRRPKTFISHGHELRCPHDRSSAHFTAWHSPKRSAEDFGKHFKLDDSRVWMRLHFWALREAGGFERSPAFAQYYIKFIGHFVSIYESSATMFARDSARWSENPKNIERYLANGRVMSDVIGVPLSRAVRDLPSSEANDHVWPYPYRR